MSARAEKISVLGIGAPTTQVEPPQGAGKAPAESEAPNMAGGRPRTTLFPYKKKKKIKPLVVENLIIVGEQLGQHVSGQPAAPNNHNFDEGDDGELGDALDKMLEREIPGTTSPQMPRNGEEEVDYDSEEIVTNSSTITGVQKEESGAPLSQDYGQGSQNDSEVKEFEGFSEDSLMDDNVQECVSQPVLTQQIIMDLIVNHPQPIMQPPNYVQGGWEEKKLGYSRLLEGYKKDFDFLVSTLSLLYHAKAHPVSTKFLGFTIKHNRSLKTLSLSYPAMLLPSSLVSAPTESVPPLPLPSTAPPHMVPGTPGPHWA